MEPIRRFNFKDFIAEGAFDNSHNTPQTTNTIIFIKKFAGFALVRCVGDNPPSVRSELVLKSNFMKNKVNI